MRLQDYAPWEIRCVLCKVNVNTGLLFWFYNFHEVLGKLDLQFWDFFALLMAHPTSFLRFFFLISKFKTQTKFKIFKKETKNFFGEGVSFEVLHVCIFFCGFSICCTNEGEKKNWTQHWCQGILLVMLSFSDLHQQQICFFANSYQ